MNHNPVFEKKEIQPYVTTWMNPEHIKLSEKGQAFLTYMWNLRKLISEIEKYYSVSRNRANGEIRSKDIVSVIR
jgi:hypothetical protein